MMTAEIEPHTQAVMDFYRGWDKFHASLPNDQKRSIFPIVDIDVAPQIGEPTEFKSLDAVEYRAAELLDQLPDSDADPSTELIRRKLTASVMFARMLGGEEFDFHNYVKTLTGVEAVPVSSADMWTEYQAVVTLLQEQGIAYNPDGAKVFHERFDTRTGKQVERMFRRAAAAGMTAVQQYVQHYPSNFDFEYAPVDELWSGYISYLPEDERFLIRVNTNAERYPMTAGRLAMLAYHEYVGHGEQFDLWRENIQLGRMNPALGIGTVHTPEVTQLEGVAQLMPQLFLSNENWEEQFEASHVNLRIMAYHNAHYAVNTGTPLEEAVQTMAEILPLEPIEGIRAGLRDSHKDVGMRAYGACNYPALQIVRPLVSAPIEKRKRVIPVLFERQLSADGMRELIAA